MSQVSEQELMQQFERECDEEMQEIAGPEWSAEVPDDGNRYFHYAARIAFAAWKLGREKATAAPSSAQEGGEGVAVAWQFFDAGKWHFGDDRIKDHRANTEAAGYPVRDLYAAPPTKTKGLDREKLLEWINVRYSLWQPFVGLIAAIERGDFDADQGGDA